MDFYLKPTTSTAHAGINGKTHVNLNPPVA